METRRKDAELEVATLGSVPAFSLDGTYSAKCVKVYDGDTATFVFRTAPGAPLTRHRCRLAGIDAPEVRGVRDLTPGKAAAEFLRRRLEGRVVTLSVSGTDKYGRLLVGVAVDGADVADQLLAAGHAVRYDGTGARFPNSS